MDLFAIDFHAHPQTEEMLRAKGHRRDELARFLGPNRSPISFAEMADRYRSRKMMAVILNADDETTSGAVPAPNDALAQAERDHPDVFFAFGAVDPWKGAAAIRELRRCKEELGIRGIGEFNPGRQHFYPNDRHFYPIWEECQRLGLIVLFHTGTLGAGAGKPGGMGFKLKYTRPIPALDDLAADFPELRIVAAHPGWPWHLESLALVQHKANVWLDLSGWAPKYLPSEVVHYTNSLISDKVLFATDWPAIDTDRYIAEFKELGLKPEVRERVLRENAQRLLGISVEAMNPTSEIST